MGLKGQRSRSRGLKATVPVNWDDRNFSRLCALILTSLWHSLLTDLLNIAMDGRGLFVWCLMALSAQIVK